jgi:very-short-patch-repair endonuclease
MARKPITNPRYQIEKRKELRSSLTAAEATLWMLIKNRQLGGRKFRRQFGVGKYILDFYCPEEKLAIELDGNYHFTLIGSTEDFKRDEFLREQGIIVLRIENRTLFQNSEEVLEYIKSHFKVTD